ncbi:decaprenyl-phosphate phosphoribosyltransferase [Streptacidiphilus pinicola]|uniref:Decaprenyl-phosphate phosphoribosyltransferase n=1 Tax=Streptacidiphilus pinicola TaxID=2219663 RepID=A0A2X0I8H5_9ACTN|nr:decaprenyl-phosphate phosphoribosyltransferase [Streptacidiphilus pinicola]RAG81204.1 decaprenyl-phosphate phosphoribosyltransferase [Streptacidiphilus pinicola]
MTGLRPGTAGFGPAGVPPAGGRVEPARPGAAQQVARAGRAGHPRAHGWVTARAVLRTTRPRQWPKNLLVLAAPLAAGSTGRDGRGPVDLALAVGAFTLAAASGYCVNDLADLERDRRHPAKRRRPLASGELTGTQGRVLAVVFALGALAAAAAVPGWGFSAVLAGYLLLSVCYSLALKHLPGVELAALASAFVLRAVGGAVAARIPPSGWFLLVCSLGALLVAAAKRAAEAELLGSAAAQHRPALAHYGPRRLRLLRTLLLAATVLAYLAWALGTGSGWHLLSTLPLLYALLRFDRLVSRDPVTRVEDLLLTDRRLVAAELLWLAAFLAPML